MKGPVLALVAAGPLSRSFITRLAVLPERLGPVLAPSYRLASRLVNSLGAGYAVRHYRQLSKAQLVLIAVPEALLEDTVDRLAGAELNWQGKIAVLCDDRLDCAALDSLSRKGAARASLSTIPGLAGQFLIEGERAAVREVKRLLARAAERIYELPCGNKALFLAGLTFAGSLSLPAADAAAKCLRLCGLPASAARVICGDILEKARRAYLHAGRKAFSGALAEGDASQVARELAALEQLDPSLAGAYRSLACLALERFQKNLHPLKGLFLTPGETAPR